MRWYRIRIVTATTHVVTCVRAPCTTYHDAKKTNKCDDVTD